MIEFFINAMLATWDLLLDSAVYMLAGLMFGGLLRVFLSPDSISKHLGTGRFMSVFKAAILGVPLPLCSCGVLPAAVSLKNQGANNGATTAFLISTPESGVDSISVTYALLDPIMTIARPVAAFFMAMAAGITENFFNNSKEKAIPHKDILTSINNPNSVACCNDAKCETSPSSGEKISLIKKLRSGLVYAFTDVWDDLAGWFFVGLILAGVITSLIPERVIGQYLGGGMLSMLLMLAVGIPLYICATASTPVAAALIMKGVSPGAALVFLLAGPATNITSLTVLTGVLGKRTTIIYLSTIALFSVAFGLSLDSIYTFFEISPKAIVGTASEVVPFWLQLTGTAILIIMSIKPLYISIKGRINQIMNRIARMGRSLESKKDPQDTIHCTGST